MSEAISTDWDQLKRMPEMIDEFSSVVEDLVFTAFGEDLNNQNIALPEEWKASVSAGSGELDLKAAKRWLEKKTHVDVAKVVAKRTRPTQTSTRSPKISLSKLRRQRLHHSLARVFM